MILVFYINVSSIEVKINNPEFEEMDEGERLRAEIKYHYGVNMPLGEDDDSQFENFDEESDEREENDNIRFFKFKIDDSIINLF